MSLSLNRRVLWPLVAVVVAAGVVLLSNQRAVTPEGVPVISDADHYMAINKQAESLVVEPLRAADAGRPLSEQDKQAMRKGAALYTAMSHYAPDKMGPYMVAAKCYLALGEHQRAVESAEQALQAAPLEKDPALQEMVRATAIEAHYVLSRAYFARGDYRLALEHAETAVSNVSNSPNYLAARAAALIQLKRYEDAKADLAVALSLDPSHKASLDLQKLLAVE